MTDLLTIEKLLQDNPSFHQWPDGSTANWAVLPEVLTWIAAHVTPGMVTLELGAGQTTVAFVVAGAHHTCVNPDRRQNQLVAEYLQSHQFTGQLNLIEGWSDMVLPGHADLPASIDLVFIDGAHRFPYPIVDWHYAQQRLVLGGIIGLDDVEVPSIRVLFDFLQGEDEWELITLIQARTAFFRYVRQPIVRQDHLDQKFNRPVSHSVSQPGNLIARMWHGAANNLKRRAS